jgi:type IV secretory pathway TrbD component
MDQADAIAGFYAPVHRALTEPILLGGAPRAVAIVNGTLASMVVVQTLEVEPIRGLEVALDHAASTAFQISGAVLCLTRSLSSLN